MPNAVDNFIKRFSGYTEEYSFYEGTVVLRYDKKAHVYLLLTPEGTLKPVDGVTNVIHNIDKSEALIPWSAKMMAQKLFATVEPFKQPYEPNDSADILISY